MTPGPSEHDADTETRGCCRDAVEPPGDDGLASDGGRTVETLRLSVPEMDCASCAATVENAVAGLDGVVVPEVRHLRPRAEVDVRFTVKGERVSTGRRKFGVVAGPGVKTGINTSLNPGVRLSPGATTTPGESVTRDR